MLIGINTNTIKLICFLKAHLTNKQKNHVSTIYSDQNVKEWMIWAADKMQEKSGEGSWQIQEFLKEWEKKIFKESMKKSLGIIKDREKTQYQSNNGSRKIYFPCNWGNV